MAYAVDGCTSVVGDLLEEGGVGVAVKGGSTFLLGILVEGALLGEGEGGGGGKDEGEEAEGDVLVAGGGGPIGVFVFVDVLVVDAGFHEVGGVELVREGRAEEGKAFGVLGSEGGVEVLEGCLGEIEGLEGFGGGVETDEEGAEEGRVAFGAKFPLSDPGDVGSPFEDEGLADCFRSGEGPAA